MSTKEIIRAWKDPKYRRTLSISQLESLPGSPAGGTVLSEEALENIHGGTNSWCCTQNDINCSTACIAPTDVCHVCG